MTLLVVVRGAPSARSRADGTGGVVSTSSSAPILRTLCLAYALERRSRLLVAQATRLARLTAALSIQRAQRRSVLRGGGRFHA